MIELMIQVFIEVPAKTDADLHETHIHTFFDGYCSTVQDLLDWFEVDLGFTKLHFLIR